MTATAPSGPVILANVHIHNVYICIHTYIHTQMHVRIYIYIYSYTHMFKHSCLCVDRCSTSKCMFLVCLFYRGGLYVCEGSCLIYLVWFFGVSFKYLMI